MTNVDVNAIARNIGKSVPAPNGEKWHITGVLIREDGVFYEVTEDYGRGEECFHYSPIDSHLAIA